MEIYNYRARAPRTWRGALRRALGIRVSATRRLVVCKDAAGTECVVPPGHWEVLWWHRGLPFVIEAFATLNNEGWVFKELYSLKYKEYYNRGFKGEPPVVVYKNLKFSVLPYAPIDAEGWRREVSLTLSLFRLIQSTFKNCRLFVYPRPDMIWAGYEAVHPHNGLVYRFIVPTGYLPWESLGDIVVGVFKKTEVLGTLFIDIKSFISFPGFIKYPGKLGFKNGSLIFRPDGRLRVFLGQPEGLKSVIRLLFDLGAEGESVFKNIKFKVMPTGEANVAFSGRVPLVKGDYQAVEPQPDRLVLAQY